MDYRDRHVVVTGGTGALGRAVPEGMPLHQIALKRDVFLRIIISFQLIDGARSFRNFWDHALVPRTRSSHHRAASPICELRVLGGTRKP